MRTSTLRLTFLPVLLLLASAARGEPASSDADFKGKSAHVYTMTGRVYRGTVVYFSPRLIVLDAEFPRKELRWAASQVQTLQVGTDVFFYNRETNILEPGRVEKPAAPEKEKSKGKGEAPEEAAVEDATVEVLGKGLTDEEATKDALYEAVRQVVGEVVDSETLVRNDRLVKEEVLLYSKGFVTSYKELERRKDEGEVVKRIRAVVRRGQVLDQLRKSGVRIQEFDGRGLYARVVTELREKRDARKMLARRFAGYPASVLDPHVVSEPRPLEKSDDEVTLGYDLELGIDPVKYREFLASTLPVLELMASRKGTCTRYARMVPAGAAALPQPFLAEDDRPSPQGLRKNPVPCVVDMRLYREDWWTADFDPKESMVLVINTASNRDHTVTAWSWYHLPRVVLDPGKLSVRTRFLKAGRRDAVKESEFAVGPMLPGFIQEDRKILHPRTHEVVEAHLIAISPYLLTGTLYGQRIVLDRKVKVALEDLRLIRTLDTRAVVTGGPSASEEDAPPVLSGGAVEKSKP
jgi:hypothetical protein